MTPRMFDPRRRMLSAWLAACALTLAAVTTTHTAAPAPLFTEPPTEAFAPTGLQSKKGYFGQLPFESIDMVNGGLTLTFTDLALPGDAGMDLRIVRTFNNQVNGGWWQMGIGDVPIRIAHPDGNGLECCDWPQLIMADGATHVARPRDEVYEDTVFLTESFWRYTTTTRTLEMPNGWVATYESTLYAGGAMLVEVHDTFGNSITPDWIGGSSTDIRPLKLESVTQTVGGSTRTVEFAYDTPSCPHTIPSEMTFDGMTWEYGCEYGITSPPSGQRLTSVTPPVGPGWSFAYVNGDGLDGSLTVTTPNGGTVLYDFANEILPSTDDVHRSVVGSRVTGGRDIVGGTWEFAYVQSSSIPARGTVTGPGGRSLEFTSEWAPSPGKWVLAEKVLRDGSTEMAKVTKAYEGLAITSAFPLLTFPALTLETLVQGGKTYATDYAFSSGSYGDYHQPSTITETGHRTRTTTRTFDDDFSAYLLNRVATETVAVSGGGSFTKSYAYDNDTGFLDSETVYGVETTYTADARGNRATATDANSEETSFTYEWGVLKNTTTPEYTISRAINADGTVASETRGGETTTFSYTAGRLNQVTPPAGDAIVTEYDDDGSWTKVTRGPTHTTTLLDGFGRPRGTWNAVNVRTAITYDADGRQTFVSHPYPHGGSSSAGDTFTYDALNRVTSVTHADSSGVTYAYTHDSSYDTVTITDELNHATEQRWEAFGSPDDRLLVGVTDAASGEWNYSYNTLGSLTAVDAPGSADRSWTYTAQNWLAQEVHPESGTVDYAEHDGMGRVTRKEVGGTGVTLTYGYDGNGRLTSINAPGSAHDATFTYDDADNRTSVVNGTVSTTISYDAANRPTQRTEVIEGESFVTQYGYDERDNLTSTTYPSGRIVEQTYDAADRLLSVIGPYGAPVWASSFTYHDAGAIAGYTSGNEQTTSVSLDARLRPNVLASGPLSLDYAHDAVGNVTEIDDSRSGFDQGFGYDALDRLTSVTGFAAATYGYDARGNRTAKNSTTYTYNGNERLTSDGVLSYTYDGVGNTLTAGAQTYTYTPLNQVATALVGGATTTYAYDGDNQRRLRVRPNGWKDYFVSGPGLVPLAEYRKAPGGSRVLVREYIYAGDRLIASVGLDPSPLASVTWTDDPIVPGVTEVKAVHLTQLRTAIDAARTAHGLGAYDWVVPSAAIEQFVTPIDHNHVLEMRTALAAVYTAAGVAVPDWDAPVSIGGSPVPTPATGVPILAVHWQRLRAARVNAPAAEVTATSFYHLDALGSVRAVTNTAGTTVRRHDFAAFGEEPAPASGADTRRFTGKERDAETGLDYFAARYYGAGIGRFTTSDPDHVGGDIFDPQSWNAYAYARNNPFRFVDPTGTDYEISLYGGTSWTLADDDFKRLQNDPGQGFFITPSGVYERRNGRMTLIGDVRYIDGFALVLEQAAAMAEAGIKDRLLEMGVGAAGGTLGLVARLATGIGALTEIAFVSNRGARAANLAANLTARKFQANLVASGFKVMNRGFSKNGSYTVLSNGSKTYTVYRGTSTGEATVQVFDAVGNTLSKIRLSGF